MAMELILTPDLYVPVWAVDADRVFLVIQAALNNPTDAEVEAYLKGFSVPTDPGAATAITVKLVTGGAPPAGDLLPVPLPDGAVLTIEPRRGSASVPSPAALSRPIGSFARLRSFPGYVRTNRIFPREFLRSEKRVLAQGAAPERVFFRWWREKTAPADFQPEHYEGATFAQMLAHQTRRGLVPDRTDPNTKFEGPQRVREHLALTFLVGRPMRLFDDAGQPLFDGLTADPADALMVFPDLKPGEDWQTVIAAPARQHGNAAGLCGLAWPVFTRGQLRALPAARVPDGFRLGLAAAGGSNWTIDFQGPDTFEVPATSPGGGGSPVTYFEALRAATGPVMPPSATVGPVPHLVALDFGKLAFVVDRNRNLVPDPGLAAALATDGVTDAWAFSSPGTAKPGNAVPPAGGLVDATNLRSLSVVSAVVAGAPGAAGPNLTAWLVVAGRLVPYRGFTDPGKRNHLLQFAPEAPLDAEAVTLVKSQVQPTGTGTQRVRVLGQKVASGQAPVPVLIIGDARARWVHDEPNADPANDATRYQPVFFLENPGADALAALGEPVRLAFPVSGAMATRWLTKRLARAAVPGGLTRFNALTLDLPAAAPQPGVAAVAKDQYDVYLARSARHLWLPLRVTYPPIDPDVARGSTDGGLEGDLAIDAWDHKELNVYLPGPPGPASPPAMLNVDTLALAGQELDAASASGAHILLRDYLFTHHEERPTPEPDPTFDELLPDPTGRAATLFERRYPNWPKVLPPAPPRLNDPRRAGRPVAPVLGFENRYGVAVFPDPGGSGAPNLGGTAWVDWPLVHPSDVVRDLGDRRAAMFEFDVPEATGGSPATRVDLLVRGNWQDEPPGDDAERARREARQAAAEFATIGSAVVRVVGVRFRLDYDASADGTALDRPFDQKLEVIYDRVATVPLADVTAALDARQERVVPVPLPAPLPDSLHLVRCELQLTRRDGLVPPDAALGAYDLFRPRFGDPGPGSGGLTIRPEDVLDPTNWGARFEPMTDAGTKQAVLRYFAMVRGAARPLLPSGQGRSPLYRAALAALMREGSWLAPRGLASERATALDYAVVPLAFLPVAADPVYPDATAEVVGLLLRAVAAYDALELPAFAQFALNDWKTFFGADGGRLPGMDPVREALAGSLQPVAAERGAAAAPGLSASLARLWRTNQAPTSPADLTWPQEFARRRLSESFALYEALKVLLVHALRGDDPAHPVPGAFERLTVEKHAHEQLPLDGSVPQTLGEDLDVFPYRKTTVYTTPGATVVPDLLLAGDPLDDLTYDNQFAVTRATAGSAEEFLESLGPPFSVNGAPAFRVELNNWDSSPRTFLNALRANGFSCGTMTRVELNANGGWVLDDPPGAGGGSGRSFLITDETTDTLRVDVVDWRGRVFSLKGGVLDLPFGPARPPGGNAIVPLIARRPVSPPRLVYQEVYEGTRRLGNEPELTSLEEILKRNPTVGVKAFDRVNEMHAAGWPTDGAVSQLDADVVALVLALDADEEGQLERDQIWLLAAPPAPRGAPASPISAADKPKPPLTDAELKALREQGLPSVDPAVMRTQWVPGTAPREALAVWLARALGRSAGLVAQGQASQDGRVTFINGPQVEAVVNQSLPNDALRVTLYRPKAADSKTFLLVMESVHAAGDRYDGLLARRTRNEAKRIALKDGSLAFEPDPRFTVLTSPAERPDPRVLTRVFEFPELYGSDGLAGLDRVPAVSLPVDPAEGISLRQLLARLEALPPPPGDPPLSFRSKPQLLASRVRVLIEHGWVTSAPLVDFDPDAAAPRVLTGDQGRLRRYGHAVRLVRVNEDPSGGVAPLGPDTPAINLPDTYRRFLMTLVFGGPDGDFLTLKDIPAKPEPRTGA
jgi:hypothetical protein